MNREDRINNSFDTFKACLEPNDSVLALQYYDKTIENLRKIITDIKTGNLRDSKKGVKDYEKDLDNLIKRRHKAEKALEKISEKSKPFIKEMELKLDDNLDLNISQFLENYDKEERSVYRQDHLNAERKLSALQESLKSEIEKIT